jgi:hypothetical protein
MERQNLAAARIGLRFNIVYEGAIPLLVVHPDNSRHAVALENLPHLRIREMSILGGIGGCNRDALFVIDVGNDPGMG